MWDPFSLARFNLFWFAWLAWPIVLGYVAQRAKGRGLRIVVVALSVLGVYLLSNAAVDRKWELRVHDAVTPEEMERATADGANRVFNFYFIAPVEAVFLSAFWFVAWRRLMQDRTERALG